MNYYNIFLGLKLGKKKLILKDEFFKSAKLSVSMFPLNKALTPTH